MYDYEQYLNSPSWKRKRTERIDEKTISYKED